VVRAVFLALVFAPLMRASGAGPFAFSGKEFSICGHRIYNPRTASFQSADVHPLAALWKTA
jgi:hypothetical protein